LSPTKPRCRPTLERCEDRLALSAATPANTLAIVPGTVPTPQGIAEVSVPVSAQNIGQRPSVIIVESIQPDPGSGLVPKVVSVRGPDGKPLPFRLGKPFVPGVHGSATIFVRDGQPGPLVTQVTGQQGTTGSFQLSATLPGDLTGTDQVGLSDLPAYTHSFGTIQVDARYSRAADANLNNQVGQDDGKLLLRNLTPPTRKIPLNVFLTLAPQDAAKGPTPPNSGGKTYRQDVTILGRTTPGSIVFTDDPNNPDYKFKGPALSTDAQGNFAIQVHLKSGINNFDFLAVDPYGQQTIRDYPILWLNYGKPV
jgi:hypothetical protein